MGRPGSDPTSAIAAASTEASTAMRSSDPTVLRALAHPLRVEILELLNRARTDLTASEVAARTGQTVANCSFHLRSLEKAGFIARAEPRGREKPWRAVHRDLNLRPDPADRESVLAAGALSALYVNREAARLTALLTSPEPFPEAEWNDAVMVNMSAFWATADEMKQLGEALVALTDAFAGRDANPSKRPEGARRGRLFAAINPEPEAPSEGEADGAPGQPG
ncbi:helix-turn-helix domain-containing protein [Actinotalea sp. M2MS4P-6]|uniref:ArsR/SmtB family transcription factor n=1 Tax=Actinotalea sp. M2MS4P-6 TaxID=2983762 RepID=UPI0021E496DC|nr:helix-turn-helix domain-containing protein [Actinotalea sp. M2MS4P-6]MCV2395395.1 helix-turn-helix domain-containing protein [Actinotalea sp. M2MS4P-6]